MSTSFTFNDLESWYETGILSETHRKQLASKNPPEPTMYYLVDVLREACRQQSPKNSQKQWLKFDPMGYKIQFHLSDTGEFFGYNLWATRPERTPQLAEALHLEHSLTIAQLFGAELSDRKVAKEPAWGFVQIPDPGASFTYRAPSTEGKLTSVSPLKAGLKRVEVWREEQGFGDTQPMGLFDENPSATAPVPSFKGSNKKS